MTSTGHESFSKQLEIEYPSAHLLLRAIIQITNSQLGFGTCYIPTLQLPHYMSDYKDASVWNQEHLYSDHNDINSEDLFRALRLSKRLDIQYRGSIFNSGPDSSEFQGIVITHGKLSQMKSDENLPTMAGIRNFSAGIMECYPHLVCTPYFTKSIDIKLKMPMPRPK